MVGTPAPAPLRSLMPALVALATLAAFWPSLRNGFVTWDDVRMFAENPHYRGLGPAQLRWAWTTIRLGEYMPLTWMSYEADYVVWGLRPLGYHLTSLLLHVAAALAVYALSLRLFSQGTPDPADDERPAIRAAAGLAALVFALHPLRVEPVAWASARGTVLGGLLLLCSALVYVTGCARTGGGALRRPWLLGAVGLFALSLLARSTGFVLPAVLVVLDVYPLRRLGGGPGRWVGRAVRPVWREKLAFLVPALGIVPLAVLARVGSGDLFRREHYDPLAGAAVALYGAAFYLRRTVLVGESAALYEAPPGWTPLDWPFVASGVLVLLLSGLFLAARRRWPGPLVAWLAYGVLLAPLSGLLPLGLLHLAADRYSYVTCVSWAVLAGAGALAGWRAWRRGRVATPVAALSLGLVVLVLAGWGALSSVRVGIWRDGKTLWAHTVSVAPGSAVGQNNLGEALEAEGDLAGAVEHYRQAARIWPSHAPFFVNLGRVLARQGRLAEAALALRAAIRLRPAAAEGHVALGVVLVSEGRLSEAVEEYRTALGIEPGSAVTHYNLGVALEKQERTADAVEEYRRALELDPGLADARVRLEAALRRLPPGQGGAPR